MVQLGRKAIEPPGDAREDFWLIVQLARRIGLDWDYSHPRDVFNEMRLCMAGLEAARRGECDIAGIHLLDPKSGEYNRPFLTASIDLIPGYGRLQGIVFREGDSRFEGRAMDDAIAVAISDASCVMVNRNQGSGTRALIDRLLGGVKPPGYAVQPRNHNAVAAAVVQGRADWGVTLDTIAHDAGLGFMPVQQEQYDFVVPRARAQRPGVKAFRAWLDDPATRERLARLGMKV